jgi:toprim domain protein
MGWVISMSVDDCGRVLIVEGKSDKKKVEAVLRDTIEIICTNGTISISRLDELI